MGIVHRVALFPLPPKIPFSLGNTLELLKGGRGLENKMVHPSLKIACVDHALKDESGLWCGP